MFFAVREKKIGMSGSRVIYVTEASSNMSERGGL